ncbi:hypothetical protein [Acetobacter sp.]|uniref:hypothetical protein n=1 Tax=Acetobacter sp. TaxID=440 RepID=UPI0039EC5AFC
MNILALWNEWSGVIGSVGGGVGGWIANTIRARLQAQANAIEASKNETSQQKLELQRDQAQAAELDMLRRREWALAGAVQDVYAEAIAVRLIVHDLDAEAGKPLRQFRPLPPYPFPAQADEPVAGATAAVTAEPRAENTHV